MVATALIECDAIVECIGEAYPSLQPDISLKNKATNRAGCYLASKNYLVQCSAQRNRDVDVLKVCTGKRGQAFDRLETQLGDIPFFAGNNIGLVDTA
jgi:glutathione S-transferase